MTTTTMERFWAWIWWLTAACCSACASMHGADAFLPLDMEGGDAR